MKSIGANLAIGRASLCLIQALLLTFGNATSASAITHLTASENSRVESLERSLFGKERSGRTDRSAEQRLTAVEEMVFGQAKQDGSADDRLDAIERVMSTDSSNFLSPPLAGMLDSLPVKTAPLAVAPEYGEEPRSPHADLIQEAMDQYSRGDTVTAERTFKRILAMDANNVDAHFNLGVIYEGKGDLNQALSSYQRALALNPQDQELKDALSSVRTKIASNENARITEARRVLDARQEQERLASLKKQVADASADYKSGRFSEAVRKLERVASQAPSDPDVQYALGQALKAEGDTARARAAFSRAVAIDPSSTLYRNAINDLNATLASSPRQSQIEDRPPGQVIPFADSPAIASERGMLDGRINASFSSSRLKRALAGGAVGAAAGALLGATTKRSVKTNAMKGALMGGVLGYLSAP